MKHKENTGILNGGMFCFNCGEFQNITVPMPVTLAAKQMKLFSQMHCHCETKEKQVVDNIFNKLKNEK